MRHTTIAALAAVLCLGFAAPVDAQTTGVTCINDYTILTASGLGGGSGTTSCTPLALTGGGPTTITVSGSSTAFFCLIFAKGTPCAPGTLCLPPSICPLPFTACTSSTNLSYDLTLPVPAPTFTCPMVPVLGTVCTECVITFNLPPSINFSTQAVLIDPVCGSILQLLPTQAYDVST